MSTDYMLEASEVDRKEARLVAEALEGLDLHPVEIDGVRLIVGLIASALAPVSAEKLKHAARTLAVMYPLAPKVGGLMVRADAAFDNAYDLGPDERQNRIDQLNGTLDRPGQRSGEGDAPRVARQVHQSTSTT